jgi:hypothetical protein
LRALKEEESRVRFRLIPKLLPVRWLALAATTSMVVMAAALAGCADQGEGERCTYFSGGGDASINGSSECASGLVCFPPKNSTSIPPFTSQAAGTLGICCPPAGATVTSPLCVAQVSGPGRMSFDGGFDTGTDAPADAGKDVGTDAPLDARPRDASRDGGDATVTDAGKDAAKDGAKEAAQDAARDAVSAPKDATPGG